MTVSDLIADMELLDSLRARGFTIRADAGKLLISPASKLTAEEQQAIKNRRAGLLEELATEEAWRNLDKCHKTLPRGSSWE